MDVNQFEGRKREHLRHALDPVHQATGKAGFERIQLRHEALPELNFSEISLAASCLGRSLSTPFNVSGMTAGHEQAPRLNAVLSEACAARGWAFGVGSQRRELEARDSKDWDRWTELRKRSPKLVLLANLGLSQAIEATTDSIRALVERLEASALAIHLNPLQEALQPEGTPQFRGGLKAIARLVKEAGIPVVVKETGCGMSESTLRRLSDAGAAAVDVSGLGGTHWGRIEGSRAAGESWQSRAAETFAVWGESTVESLLAARRALSKQTELWASGGVRSGLDSAKAIALGAHRVGYAQPALKAALEGEAALESWMKTQEQELRVALFCTGCSGPGELREKEGVWRRSDT